MVIRLFITGLIASAVWCQVPQKPPESPTPPLFKGDRDKDKDPNARQVEGTVKDSQENPVPGAVVKLKDTKSLQVRSFITKDDGKFRFTGLRKDIDYEVRADQSGRSSPMKTVSVFDDRKVVVITLKLEDKKEEK
jgi:hypothetical protein